MTVMNGVRLPGDSTVQHVTVDVPEPGHGQVLLRMKASSICGSDIRAIYRRAPRHRTGGLPGRHRRPRTVRPGRHRGPRLPTAAARRPRRRLPHRRVRRLRGVPLRLHDRLHLTTSCRARVAARRRARRVPAGRGGHLHPAARAALLRRRCARLVWLRHRLRGRCCAWKLSGQDRLLITGLGPVGLAAAMLGRALGAGPIIATDVAPERLEMANEHGVGRPRRPGRRAGHGDDPGAHRRPRLRGQHRLLRQRLPPAWLPWRTPATWGRCAFVGEGGQITFAVSELLIHKQITPARLLGDLPATHGGAAGAPGAVEPAPRAHRHRSVHPRSGRRGLRVADRGAAGKVCIVFA